jgi:diaminopimelate decarboxylase
VGHKNVNEKGHFLFGGWDVTELAAQFGTPLYVLSEEAVRARCRAVKESFMDRWKNSLAVYAGKAFLPLAMCRIIAAEGLGLDVVSGGELHTAKSAGFPMEKIFFHGNSKTAEELRYALETGVGRIVVDGPSELDVLEEVARAAGKQADILLRVTPGVDAHTHKYILTGQTGSKFGFPLSGNSLRDAVQKARKSQCLSLKGFHFHIGSQIFENTSHVMAVGIVVKTLAEFSRDLGFIADELNMGGGYGVEFDPERKSPSIDSFTDAMMEALSAGCESEGIPMPRVVIEPGRWIVSEAGITLYTVQAVKTVDGMVTYAGVDGGMTDNPRPSLYGAKYWAVAAGKMNMEASATVTVAGKCCESGDVLIEGLKVPALERGDVLAVLNTGAYTFSMASNYNRIPRPAAVLVSPGKADVIAERQTYDDVLRWDRIPEHLQ